MLKEGTKKVPFFICTLNLFHLSLHQQIKQTMAKVNLDKHIWEGWTVLNQTLQVGVTKVSQQKKRLKSGAWKISRTTKNTFPML